MRFALIAMGLALVACGDDPADWEPGRPRIDDLRYLAQVPGEPLALNVELDFTDSDGDLSGGDLLLMVDCEPAGQKSMIEVFQQQSPEVALDATTGLLEVIVRLTQDVEVGTAFRVGVVIVDRMGKRSNEPYFELQAF